MAAPRTAAAASASICKAAEFPDMPTAAFDDPRLPRPIDPDDEAAEPAAVLVALPLAELVTVRGTAELAPPFPPSAAYAELAPAAASDEMYTESSVVYVARAGVPAGCVTGEFCVSVTTPLPPAVEHEPNCTHALCALLVVSGGAACAATAAALTATRSSVGASRAIEDAKEDGDGGEKRWMAGELRECPIRGSSCGGTLCRRGCSLWSHPSHRSQIQLPQIKCPFLRARRGNRRCMSRRCNAQLPNWAAIQPSAAFTPPCPANGAWIGRNIPIPPSPLPPPAPA